MTKQNQWIPPREYANIRRRLDPITGALCDLLRTTGFRVDDVLHTTVGDWRGDKVTIKESKTNNVRTVELTPEAKAAVRRLLAYRPNAPDDEPLCRGQRFRPGDRPWLHRSTVYRRFTQAAFAAGYKNRGYTVHSLRKMYARDRYNATQSLLAVQRDLGHKNLTTTMWYVCGSEVNL